MATSTTKQSKSVRPPTHFPSGSKWQACIYQAKRGSDWRDGLARMTHGFGLSSISHLVDASTGKSLTPYDYQLTDGPMKHIDFGYGG